MDSYDHPPMPVMNMALFYPFFSYFETTYNALPLLVIQKAHTPAMSLGPGRVPVESGFDAPVKLNEFTELLNWRAPYLLQAICRTEASCVTPPPPGFGLQ